MRRVLSRALAVLGVALVVGVIGTAVIGWLLLRASLPRQSGTVLVEGLDAAVNIERDARGVPRIVARSLDDAMAALGYVHAQERYFQMDGQRRYAAGELAELFGTPAAERDERMRRYRLRAVSERVIERLPAHHKRWIDAYTRGVNAGLSDLGARPPEYVVLRATPAPWRPEDTVLVMYSMYHSLAIGLQMEKRLEVMKAALPLPLVEFLTPETTRFDAPLIGSREPYAGDGPAPIPGPDVIDLRGRQVGSLGAAAPAHEHEPQALGSNCWAVSGARTADGRALLANDMHLQLMVPATWFHAEIDWGSGWSVGVSLPGVPGIVVGSNSHIAWGCTNLNADVEDYVVVRADTSSASRYLTADGAEDFETSIEQVLVRGAETRNVVIRSTRWGTVTDTDSSGRPLVLKWPALDPDVANLALLDLIECRTLEEGVLAARRWSGPPQNVTIASADGRIAWVVSGWHPKRSGIDGRYPAEWREPSVGWDGPAPESDRPMLIDPPGGMLATANNRAMSAEWARRQGGFWASGERAGRILEMLREGGVLDERKMLGLQLDTRVASLDFYRDLVLRISPAEAPEGIVRAARRTAERWNGRADADEIGMTLVVEFRAAVHAAILRPLLEPCTRLDKDFRYSWFHSEEPLRRMLEEQPAHLLPPGHSSWETFLLAMLERAAERAGLQPVGDSAAGESWGYRNRASIRHPMSSAAPFLRQWLDMARDPLPGHISAVRVQSPSFGASQRLVVAPGHEHHGILQVPCGQSGHFLSPHYRDAQDEWSEGRPAALRAGSAQSVVRLSPRTR